jgi:hypothetical protein
MDRLERFLFPRFSLCVSFLVAAFISGIISFLLIGSQIYQANWGMIDDHEVFAFLGPKLDLPLGDVWRTLLSQTASEFVQARFRPSYYAIKLLETSFWGANVHLWYLTLTLGFTVFLTSMWWVMRRFIGGWLSAALTATIALLPLWAGVWSRLGPQESYGAACVGLMILSADFAFFSRALQARMLSAIALILATIVLIGMKETFFPIAVGTLGFLIFAGVRQKLPPILSAIFAGVIFVCISGMAFLLSKLLANGTDNYGTSVGLWSTLKTATIGMFIAFLRTWWLFIIPVFIMQMLQVIPRKSAGSWIADSKVALGAYLFLVGIYGIQCAPYGLSFPHNNRYDFPAMLLLPLTCCILACEFFKNIRPFFPDRTINYAQFAAATFLIFALVTVHLGNPPELIRAVRKNIATTNSFYNELQGAIRTAEGSPDRPILLEPYDEEAYEGIFSLSVYLRALGTKNSISVRLVPESKSREGAYGSFRQRMSDMEEQETGVFTPLRDSLTTRASKGCISIAINGTPDPACSGFRVNTK